MKPIVIALLLLFATTAESSESVKSMFSEAFSYYGRGDYKEASSTIRKAYDLAEREFKGQYVLGDLAYQVAAVHQNIGDYDIAEKYHLINLEIKKKHLKLPDGQLIVAYNNVASTKILKKNFKEALEILSGLDIDRNQQSAEEMSYVYANLARCYLEINELNSAQKYLDRALNYFKRHYDPRDIIVADLEFTKAELLQKKGRTKEALALAENILVSLKRGGYSRLPFYKEVSDLIDELE